LAGRTRSEPLPGTLVLKNATVPAALVADPPAASDGDGLVELDIFIRDGRFERVAGPGDSRGYPIWELSGRMVFPCFVDCHTHIDKGHIWPRRPNPDGTFMSALDAARGDREARWTAEDVARRMDFSLRSAYAHGTAAMRTHIDSLAPQDAISWPVFEELRADWKGRIELQGASLVTIDEVRDRVWFARLADRVARAGGVLGVAAFLVPDLDELLDYVVRAAAERGLDLDFHADETEDPNACALDRIAETVLSHRFGGRVLVGHCCSLARHADDVARKTLDKVARAGIAVVSLPLCNLYLLDRRTDRTTPRWRGATLVHEMKARGIKIAIASDNTRDPFYAYGDLDMLEVYRLATRILHLDHPVGDWPAAATLTPAEIMGLDGFGQIASAAAADFIVFRGRSWSELLSRPESDRIVVRRGKTIDSVLPGYEELDDLMKAAG
jgi:cytosine deaminase